MISEETLEELKCASSDENHFAIEPISLAKCGHSICKKCIPKNNIHVIKCSLCGLLSVQDFSQFEVSKASQKLLKMCLEDVFKVLERESSLKLTEIKENIKDKRELVEVKCKNIKDEIDESIKVLVNKVLKMGDRLKSKLEDIENDTLSSITNEIKIDDFGFILKELDENIKNKANLNEGYLDNFQLKVREINNFKKEINSLKNIKGLEDGTLKNTILQCFKNNENEFCNQLFQYFEKESSSQSTQVNHQIDQVAENNKQKASTSGPSIRNVKMEIQNAKFNNKDSTRFFDFTVNKDESEFVSNNWSSGWPLPIISNKGPLPDWHLKHSMKSQISLNGFEDDNYQNELPESKSNGNSNLSRNDYWTEDDYIRLIVIVNKVGQKWKMIANNYKKYFKNENANTLSSKYYSLTNKKSLFQNLSEKSQLVKNFKSLKCSDSNTKINVKWSEIELAHLVHGAAVYGSRWDEWDNLLKNYRNFFHHSRTSKELLHTYKNLKRNPKRFMYFQNMAKFLK